LFFSSLAGRAKLVRLLWRSDTVIKLNAGGPATAASSAALIELSQERCRRRIFSAAAYRPPDRFLKGYHFLVPSSSRITRRTRRPMLRGIAGL